MIGGNARKLVFLAFLAVAAVPGTLIPSDQASPDDKYAKMREARRLTKSALEYMDKGIYDSALSVIDSVLSADSSDADGWYYRALLQIRSVDTASAIESLSQGAVRAPLSTRIRLLLARLELAAGDSSKAEAALDQILAIKPHESEALYLKGLAQLLRSDTTEALESFERALGGVYQSMGDL